MNQWSILHILSRHQKYTKTSMKSSNSNWRLYSPKNSPIKASSFTSTNKMRKSADGSNNFGKLHITKVFTVTSDLKSKVDAALMLNKSLLNKEKELQRQIQDLNDRSKISLSMLDERKEMLISENDNLRNCYLELPSVEFLKSQLVILSQILNTTRPNKVQPKTKDKLDIQTMRKLGILQRTEEDLTILPERLNYLVNRHDAMERAKKSAANKSPIKKYKNKETPEEHEIRKKIQLLKVATKSSFDLIQFQCDLLQSEVQKLKVDISTMKMIQNTPFCSPIKSPRKLYSNSKNLSPYNNLNLNSASNSNFPSTSNFASNSNTTSNVSFNIDLVYDQDVKDNLQKADGNIDLLKINGNNEYEYNGFQFRVFTQEDRKDELFAESGNDVLPLFQFLSNIVHL